MATIPSLPRAGNAVRSTPALETGACRDYLSLSAILSELRYPAKLWPMVTAYLALSEEERDWFQCADVRAGELMKSSRTRGEAEVERRSVEARVRKARRADQQWREKNSIKPLVEVKPGPYNPATQKNGPTRVRVAPILEAIYEVRAYVTKEIEVGRTDAKAAAQRIARKVAVRFRAEPFKRFPCGRAEVRTSTLAKLVTTHARKAVEQAKTPEAAEEARRNVLLAAAGDTDTDIVRAFAILAELADRRGLIDECLEAYAARMAAPGVPGGTPGAAPSGTPDVSPGVPDRTTAAPEPPGVPLGTPGTRPQDRGKGTARRVPSSSTVLPPSSGKKLDGTDAAELPRVLAILDGVGRSGRGHKARCPAHDDERASLTVSAGDRRAVLVNCKAGCSQTAVWQAINARLGGAAPVVRIGKKRQAPARSEAAQLGRVEAVYQYRSGDGSPLYELVRHEGKEFRYRRREPGARGYVYSVPTELRTLYNLDRLAADSTSTVYLTEGEKDADTLTARGLLATTSGGAGSWRDRFAELLAGRRVVVLPDNDDSGRAYAAAVAGSLDGVAASVRVLELRGLAEHGDVSDWLASGHTVEELRAEAEQAGKTAPRRVTVGVAAECGSVPAECEKCGGFAGRNCTCR